MKILDVFPSKGSFQPGQAVELWAELGQLREAGAQLKVSFWHLAERLDELWVPIGPKTGPARLAIRWQPSGEARRGFGVQAGLLAPGGAVLDQRWTAFDVLNDWTEFPRYGFLSDFAPGRSDLDEVFDQLRRFHINGLQFYDWQYRHDHLISPEREYLDPLGRALSLDTLDACLSHASDAGMASMAYGAVYAASAEYWRANPQAALYDEHGAPVPFGDDFLGLMNPAAGSPWASHLGREFDRALGELGFDGIHLDQYGEPRTGFDAAGSPVDLPGAFIDFIAAQRARHPRACLTFNAVSGWPLLELVEAPLDFLYVEIWPPMVAYDQVVQLLREARAAAPDRAVVVACYLPPGSAANLLTLEALTFSLGCSRIEIGEAGRLLSDPYFPKHQAIPPELKSRMRAYYDFAVRYGELLGPRAETLSEPMPKAPEGVWAFPRRADDWLAVSLVNARLIEQPHWDERHGPPAPVEPLVLELALPDRDMKAVWWASPDRRDPALRAANWEVSGGRIRIAIPHLDTWSLVALEMAGGRSPS